MYVILILMSYLIITVCDKEKTLGQDEKRQHAAATTPTDTTEYSEKEFGEKQREDTLTESVKKPENQQPSIEGKQTNDKTPKGHLLPLGHHQPPQGEIQELDEFPAPWIFYSKYVKPGRPFVIRKALDKLKSPAYSLWSDDYLRKHYGDKVVSVENGKKEVRGNEGRELRLSEFLDIYNQSDLYLVDDVGSRMGRDLVIPPCLLCGGFLNYILYVIMWFSSGGTKSVLHHDPLDNINCLVTGEKEFVFINKTLDQDVEADWFNNTGFSYVDVEKVDMVKFPRFRAIPWYYLKMKSGDCLFIPYKWYHHVNSQPGRNLAVNIWFYHLQWFNDSDCQEFKSEDISKRRSFLDVKRVSSINSERQKWLEDMYSGDNKMFSFKEFSTNFSEDYRASVYLKNLFDFIDHDKNEFVTWEEMYKFDLSRAIEIFPELFEDQNTFNENQNSHKSEHLHQEL